jgi:hypothetical protein
MKLSAYIIPGIKRSFDEIVSAEFGVPVEGIKAARRFRPQVEARQFCMWYQMKFMGYTQKQARRVIRKGPRHSLACRRTISNLLQTDKGFIEKATGR